MRSTSITAFALAFGVLGSTSPVTSSAPKGNSSCTDPPVRKEWRGLTDVEKEEYIDAVLCLQTKPPITTRYDQAVNAFDDLHGVHWEQTPKIHWVGHFILWHRYMIASYESRLRDSCGYKGANPYWDWSIDAAGYNSTSMAIFESEIFSELGMGGNGVYVNITAEQDPYGIARYGRTGGGCVDTGPFQKPAFSINVNETEPGACLRRDFIPFLINWWAEAPLVQDVLDTPDYTSFARLVEGNPTFDAPNIHGSGHFGSGGVLGQIGNSANSPSDPLFYLHHSNLDHIFWMWQQKDPEARLHQVGGPIEPMGWGVSENVTLDFEVDLGEVAGPVKLHDLLDTRGETLCYTYA